MAGAKGMMSVGMACAAAGENGTFIGLGLLTNDLNKSYFAATESDLSPQTPSNITITIIAVDSLIPQNLSLDKAQPLYGFCISPVLFNYQVLPERLIV